MPAWVCILLLCGGSTWERPTSCKCLRKLRLDRGRLSGARSPRFRSNATLYVTTARCRGQVECYTSPGREITLLRAPESHFSKLERPTIKLCRHFVYWPLRWPPMSFRPLPRSSLLRIFAPGCRGSEGPSFPALA